MAASPVERERLLVDVMMVMVIAKGGFNGYYLMLCLLLVGSRIVIGWCYL